MKLKYKKMKKLIVFDLDGTLAESKSALDDEMGQLLQKLVEVVNVSIISGGGWTQFQKQLLSNLPNTSDFKNLFLLPTCGTQFYQYKGGWEKLYSEDLTSKEKDKITASLEKAVNQAGYNEQKVWGETIEDRGSQITFSALGQKAPKKRKNGTLISGKGNRFRPS
ncbi:hypothetical protein MASR1M74_28100 [Lentimicrobium sp.]